jgi:hypothetical protein
MHLFFIHLIHMVWCWCPPWSRVPSERCLRCSAVASQINLLRLHREIIKTRCQRLLYAAAGRGREGLTLPCMHGAYVRVHVQARRSGQEHGAVMCAYTYMVQARPRQCACMHVQAMHTAVQRSCSPGPKGHLVPGCEPGLRFWD